MKKALLIFGLIALVGIIGFGATVATLGVRNNNYSVSLAGQKLITPVSFGAAPAGEIGEIKFIDGSGRQTDKIKAEGVYRYEFRSGIPSDLRVNMISGAAEVSCGDVEYATVEYIMGTDEKYSLTAELSDGKLEITEEHSAMFGAFANGTAPRLCVTLPERAYGNVDLNNVSGSVKADGVECGELSVHMVSGSGSYNVYADEISAEMMSGDIKLKNCSDKGINELKVQTLSGTVDIDGFAAKETKINSMSGKITAGGLAGDVTLESTSGTAELGFSEWTGDLKIEKISGGTNVKLPSGAGIDLEVSCTSGGVSVTYDGDTDHYGDDDEDRIGGSNVHEVKVSITSGGVNIDIEK